MHVLHYNPDTCRKCETYDCLRKCQYLELDHAAAKSEIDRMLEGGDSPVLHDCVTCYACEEYCPGGNHPFYRIVELQEEKGILPVPRPIIDQQIKMFAPKGGLEITAVGDTAVSLCLFPSMKDRLEGELFDQASILTGRHFFCNLVYLHFGNHTVIKSRVQHTIDSFAVHGVQELVCFHDECYGLFKSYAPAYGFNVPFRPVHLFEYLYEKLQSSAGRLNRLNLKIAYQRPCSSRLTPEKEHYLDKICALIGVERVARQYDRENALCCAAVIRSQGRNELADYVQDKNIKDMIEYGAVACVFNCPFCYMTLSEAVLNKGLWPVLISDLCRMALGEEIIEST